MPAPRPAHPARLWLRPDQAGLLARVSIDLGVRIEGVGCVLSGRAEEALSELTRRGAPVSEEGVQTRSDLRADLAAARGGMFLLAEPGALGAGAEGAQRAVDVDTLRDAASRGVRVFSLEPIPASLMALGEAMAQPLPPLLLGPTEPAAGGAGPGAAPLPTGNGGPAGAGASSGAGVGGGGDGGSGAWAPLVPSARYSRAVQDVLHLREHFGPVRSAVVQCLGAPAEGSLGARLLDAMDIVQMFLGEPDTIDASYTGPTPDPSRPVFPLPGESLRNLHGDLTANLRFSGGRAAALAASDRAGRFETLVTLIGPAGRVRVFNDGFEWTDAHGVKIDESRHPSRRRGGAGRRATGGAGAAGAAGGGAGAGAGAGAVVDPSIRAPTSACAAAIVEQVRRLMELGAAATAGQNHARVLAMAQAALLSARTGEGESPATMLRLVAG